ncbi:MAG: class I SAM-dependent methyltransferase [bacterium]
MIDGYSILPNGVIKQKSIFNKIQTYDNDYIQTYEEYGEIGIRMSYLRLGNIIGALGYKPREILDVGYGNGDFLRVTRDSGIKSYGSDISGYPTPNGVEFVSWDNVLVNKFEVITFFDCLEHFKDISFVKDLMCDFIVITLPWCHYYIEGDEWFKNWKHRKPDEHLWHFNDESLSNFMKENGYMYISTTNVEDVIRKPIDNNKNILTGIYKKNG